MNRFVITVKGLSQEQEERFIKTLTDKKMGWWHMVNDFWLISTHDDSVTCDDIRDELKVMQPTFLIVIESKTSKTWSGFGQVDNFDWMADNWDK